MKESPSVDQWLKEAKADESAPRCGMYLTHNGTVRELPKKLVRQGIDDGTKVVGMNFSYDEAGVEAARQEALQMPGIEAPCRWATTSCTCSSAATSAPTWSTASRLSWARSKTRWSPRSRSPSNAEEGRMPPRLWPILPLRCVAWPLLPLRCGSQSSPHLSVRFGHKTHLRSSFGRKPVSPAPPRVPGVPRTDLLWGPRRAELRELTKVSARAGLGIAYTCYLALARRCFSGRWAWPPPRRVSAARKGI